MSKKMMLMSMIILSALSHAGTRKLAVQYAVQTKAEIRIDGRLDEPAWKKTPAFTDYRCIRGPEPKKTSIRILWGEHGVYFGVINHVKQGYHLKTTIRTRDGGAIWADDSSEFYIDPKANGYGLFKFDINSAGAISDFWQVDPGYTDSYYSASSAQAACQLGPDRWTMEFFVSYGDLHAEVPKEGQIWAIMHRRLDYTEGTLTDMSTSGGNYFNKQFGYVFMTKDGTLPEKTVLESLKRYATPPWLARIGKLYVWTDGQKDIGGTAEHVQAHFRKLLALEIGKLENEQKKNFQKEKEQIKEMDSTDIIRITNLLDKVKKQQKENQLDTLFE